jgi:hypothetical protein
VKEKDFMRLSRKYERHHLWSGILWQLFAHKLGEKWHWWNIKLFWRTIVMMIKKKHRGG